MLHPSGLPAVPVAGGTSGRRVQYAALPYRVRRDGEVQIRLITSRETRRWVIPKGWPMKGLSPPKAAARECYEEAGLMGVTAREAFGMYTYEKRLGTRSVLCDVLVFPLKVKRHLQKWPERFQRYGFWFSIDSAAAAVQEEDLSLLIRAFGDLMARRWEAKQKEAAEEPPKEKTPKQKQAKEKAAKEKGPKDKELKEKPSKAKPEKEKAPKDKLAKALPKELPDRKKEEAGKVAKSKAQKSESGVGRGKGRKGRAAAEGGVGEDAHTVADGFKDDGTELAPSPAAAGHAVPVLPKDDMLRKSAAAKKAVKATAPGKATKRKTVSAPAVKSASGKPPGGKGGLAKLGVGKAAMGKSASGKPASGKSATGKSSTGKVAQATSAAAPADANASPAKAHPAKAQPSKARRKLPARKRPTGGRKTDPS